MRSLVVRSPGVRSAAAAVLGMLLLLPFLAACGGGDSAPGALALVVGAHSNAIPPSMVATVRDEVASAIDDKSSATVIVADGAPKAIETMSLAASSNAYAPNSRAGLLDAVGHSVESARATSPEVDLLGAIDLAARSVADATGPRTIVVIDPGLQTTGALHFQDGLLAAQPDDVVNQLRATRQLPDLHGVRVVFVGLGDVTAPQQPLPQPDQSMLDDLWPAIVSQAGGSASVVQAPLPARPTPAGLPPVTPVPIDPPPSIGSGPLPPLPDSAIGFLPDQATFRDPATARDVLGEYAQAITARHRGVTLVGTTADVGPDAGQVALARQRAAAVRDVLVQLGVPADDLATTGVGSHFAGFQPDHDPDGSLDPALAARNRLVIFQ